MFDMLFKRPCLLYNINHLLSQKLVLYIFLIAFSCLQYIHLSWNLFFNMVETRSQLENLSKDELIDRLLQIENIEDKLEHLTSDSTTS